MKKAIFVMTLMVSLLLMGFDEFEVTDYVPREVEKTVQENYEEFLTSTIKGDYELSAGRIIAVNQLIIDNRMNISVEPSRQWMSPFYQNGIINGELLVWEPSKGHFEIAGMGYSRDLPSDLATLKQGEAFIYNRQFGLAFAYSAEAETFRPLGSGTAKVFEKNGIDLKEGISKIEAEKLIEQYLLEVYPDRFESSDNKYYYVLVISGVVLMIGVLAVIFIRKIIRNANMNYKK